MHKLGILSLAFLLSAGAARAESVIDFSTHIVDLDGGDIIPPDSKDKKPLDLEAVAETALLTPDSKPRATGGPASAEETPAEEKIRLFALALKIHSQKRLSLSADEVVLLKRRIAAIYAPLVVGRASALLDPPAVLPEPPR